MQDTTVIPHKFVYPVGSRSNEQLSALIRHIPELRDLFNHQMPAGLRILMRPSRFHLPWQEHRLVAIETRMLLDLHSIGDYSLTYYKFSGDFGAHYLFVFGYQLDGRLLTIRLGTVGIFRELSSSEQYPL